MKHGAGHVPVNLLISSGHKRRIGRPNPLPDLGSATSPFSASANIGREHSRRQQGSKKVGQRRAFSPTRLRLCISLSSLVFKTNFIDLSLRTLGWSPPPSELIFALCHEWIVDQAERDRGVPDGSALLLGDSIIAQLDPLSIGPQIVNFGLAGDTTRTMLRRLPTFPALARAQGAVIGVGSNDLRYRGLGGKRPLFTRASWTGCPRRWRS